MPLNCFPIKQPGLLKIIFFMHMYDCVVAATLYFYCPAFEGVSKLFKLQFLQWQTDTLLLFTVAMLCLNQSLHHVAKSDTCTCTYTCSGETGDRGASEIARTERCRLANNWHIHQYTSGVLFDRSLCALMIGVTYIHHSTRQKNVKAPFFYCIFMRIHII